MARCKLTRMSLRNIRKDKQYQCIIIDLVRTGVVSKSTAEGLLNYTIPAGLLESSAYVPDADDEPGTDSGGDSGSTETTTLKVNIGQVYDSSGIWSLSKIYGQESGNPLEIKVGVPTDVVTRLNSVIKAAAESDNDADVTSNTDWLAFSTALSTAVQAAIENNPDIKTGLGYSSDTNLTIMPTSIGDFFCLLDKNGNSGTALFAYSAENNSKTYMGTGNNNPPDTSNYTDFLNPDTVYVVDVNAEE